MRSAISFLLALALTVISASALIYFVMFGASGFLIGCVGFVLLLGAIWLWEDAPLSAVRLFYKGLAFLIGAAVVLLLLAAAQRALADVVTWLKTAHTPDYSNGRLLHDVGILSQQDQHTGWLGFQKILGTLFWAGPHGAA